MKILFGFFLCGTLMLSAATQSAPDAVFKEQDMWSFRPDLWSKKEALVIKGMSRDEVIEALGKWYSVKTLKNEPDVEILRFYRDTPGRPMVQRFAGQNSLHYFIYEDRIEVFMKSGVLVDVVVTRGPGRERHDEIAELHIDPFNHSQPVAAWNSTGGMMMEKEK